LFAFSANAEKINNSNSFLRSFNFKLYYTAGGEKLANEIIMQAENNLESMENFLGTRMVEQIDIYLSEQPFERNILELQRNGRINLDNSSVYLTYSGSETDVIAQLKKQLAEILINGMLYGNTVKERLKNNREINVPNWYVSGLSRYVAGGNLPDMSWMADYYEDKLKLNLNLISQDELSEFGHAIFLHINDSFGMSKLRQLLFYTKLSGKTEFAFEYVFNKSLNQMLSDWYKLSKKSYLADNLSRLPNDPETIGKMLQNATILDLKFNEDASIIDFLIKTEFGIQLWCYDLESRKSKRKFKTNIIDPNISWSFLNTKEGYLLAESNGIVSKLSHIINGKIVKRTELNFAYIKALKSHPISGITFLGQKDYQTDVYRLFPFKNIPLVNLTRSEFEETDYLVSKDTILYFTAMVKKQYLIYKRGNPSPLYSTMQPVFKLNTYLAPYLSLIQKNSTGNFGLLINPMDTAEKFRVTNYNRSILFYDYNSKKQKVLEGIKYGNVNYVVISEASIDKAKLNFIEMEVSLKEIIKTEVIELDSTVANYKLITGFEYKKVKEPVKKSERNEVSTENIKVRTYLAPLNEFKSDFIRLGFSNTTFNSPMFATFFPLRQGLNNGPNIIVGAGVYDIKKRFYLKGNIRQPITGKGTDFDFSFQNFRGSKTHSITLFNSNFQKEIYNQLNRFTIRQVSLNSDLKLNSRLHVSIAAGYRSDKSIPLSESESNLQRDIINLNQPFINLGFQAQIANKTKTNYKHKIIIASQLNSLKPLQHIGYNTNLHFKLQQVQWFFRTIMLSTEIHAQSSIGNQKTVFLLGGSTNWLRPVFGDAPIYSPEKVRMYSATADFEGLPYNYSAGTSIAMAKVKLAVPLNPILSQQNFNQNLLKFLTARCYANLGTTWFGKNPFSITNPNNQDIIETGSMTIINYSAKNPLIVSWGVGINSVLFGYEFGFDYAIGYNERGRIGKFTYFTVGKSFN